MHIQENIRLTGADGRSFLLDCYLPAGPGPHPVAVFAHGFKGFKDWGHWHLIGRSFVASGFAFVKFNFSHNGTTPDQPAEFADLEAFGQNNYTRELADLGAVFHWLIGQAPALNLDPKNVALIGHSRGGGLAVIFARQDPRVRALITWASVSSLDYLWRRDPRLVAPWREEGVLHLQNARTGQQMPLYFQLFEDFQAHAPDYDVERAARSLDIPYLIVHGTADPGVPATAAEQLHAWSESSRLHLVEGGDHVFGGRHPFEETELPVHSLELVRASLDFLAPLKRRN